MSRVIAQRELRNQNAQILAAVEAGASFVVTRNGTPVAALRPLARGRRLRVPRAEIAAVAAAAGIVALVSLDGESNWLEGSLLLGVYVILGVSFFYLT